MLAKSLLVALAALLGMPPAAAQDAKWNEVLAKARGQTVNWNAWAGDEKTNAFIAWVGDEVQRRYGVRVNHVKLKDTAEAVTRVVAEKAAGRDRDGSVDLVWINGPNFLAMKQQNLLFGPFGAARCPTPRASTPPTSAPTSSTSPFRSTAWSRRGGARSWSSSTTASGCKATPRSVPELLAWAQANPGRFTHPNVRNFLGSTFLKQALYELTPDPAVLQQPATDANFAAVTAPLWAWYDQLRPQLWRGGRQFPENGPAQRQLLNDGEIDILISFNPSEAAVSIDAGLLPDSVRTFVFAKGTIGNTSFVAIPYNAANKEGAMVVADFLLDPATQARAQDIRQMGNFTVLDLTKLTPAERQRFANCPARRRCRPTRNSAPRCSSRIRRG